MSERESDKVEALLRLFERYGLEELMVEEPGFTIHLRRSLPQSPPPVATPLPMPAASAPQPVSPERTLAVRAPLIGIFYASPAPDSPPFVRVGEVVREGQTVCIVEAMKVFNEIKSDWAGRVAEIPPQSGQLVQAGDPLVVLEPLSER